MADRTANVERFMYHYRPALAQAIADHPGEYSPTPADVVADRMQAAFECGTYNHDSRAIRAACRAIGLRPTRTALEQFFGPLA